MCVCVRRGEKEESDGKGFRSHPPFSAMEPQHILDNPCSLLSKLTPIVNVEAENLTLNPVAARGDPVALELVRQGVWDDVSWKGDEWV